MAEMRSVMRSVNFIVRNMKNDDYEQMHNVLRDVGFDSGKYLNKIMFNIDCHGFFVAEQLETGKILGLCVGFNHSPSFAFIGQYAVLREYQGKGIGTKLWQKVTEYIGTERNRSLFAAPKMFPKYRDSYGFELTPQRKFCRYYGIPNYDGLIKHVENITIVKVNDNNLKDVIKYDMKICDGFSRDLYLEGYSKAPETIFLLAKNNSNEIKGFCIMTTSVFDIALPQPLYADTKEIAELLIFKCCVLMPVASTNGIFFLCFDSNSNAIELALKMDLKLKIIDNILFTKKIIDGDLSKIYCVSTSAFYPF